MGNTAGDDRLSEYYRKGRNSKPCPTNAKNDNIPTSGTIKASDFYGGNGDFSTLHTANMYFVSGAFGGYWQNSVSPSTVWSGQAVELKTVGAISTGPQYVTLLINGNRGQSFFSSILIAGKSLTSSSATYQYTGGKSGWSWFATSDTITMSAGNIGFYMYE